MAAEKRLRNSSNRGGPSPKPTGSPDHVFSREAPRHLGPVARYHTARARAAPAGGAYDPQAAPRPLPLSAPPARRHRRVAAHTVTAAIRTLTGERDLAVGIVACLQTHGLLSQLACPRRAPRRSTRWSSWCGSWFTFPTRATSPRGTMGGTPIARAGFAVTPSPSWPRRRP